MLAAVAGAAFVAVAALGVQGHSTVHALTNCTLPAGADASLSSDELAFLDLINDYRAGHGLGALTPSATLNHAATWFAVDLGVNDYFSHGEPSGRDFSTRVHDCGYPKGGWEGENIAAGNPLASPEKVFDAWRDSPGHDENMLRAEFTYIGIARERVEGSYYGHYWVTDFGSLPDTPAAPAATPTPAPTPQPEPPAAPALQPISFDMTAGVHLITWPEANESISQAIAGHEHEIRAIYAWSNGYWLRYIPDSEPWMSSLTNFEQGQSYWVFSR
jgi:uncharacterized protein YkwD